MPPKSKSSQKRVQTLTDEEQLEVECKRFCEYLEKEKKKHGQIKDTLIVKSIGNILMSYKEQAMSISDGIVSDLVAVLEDGGKELCGRMVAPVFCMVLAMMLQADPLLMQAQRAVFLLSGSLEPANIQNKNIQEKRCTAIGARYLKNLLVYFTNIENERLMRRWIGSLCSLLIRGSEKNLRILENCEEDLRRAIGELVFREVDDSIKIIAGGLIKAAADAGTNYLDLWPADIDSRLLVDFPALPRTTNWAKEFYQWLIYMETKFMPPEAIGKIAFVHGIQFRLNESSPDLVYENLFIFVHEEILSFLLLSPNRNMDQILDVTPLASIESITGVGDQSSQARELEIRFGLGCDGSVKTFWNGHQCEVGEIIIRMDLDSVEGISPELLEACPNAKIIRLDGSEILRELRQRGLSGDAISLGSPDLRRRLDPDDESPSDQQPQKVTNAGDFRFDALGVREAKTHKTSLLGSTLDSKYIQDEDLYDASPPKSKAKGIKASGQQEHVDQEGSIAKPRAENIVRPKAKPPLVQSHRRLNDNQGKSQKQIEITCTGTRTKNQITDGIVPAVTNQLAHLLRSAQKETGDLLEDTNNQKGRSDQDTNSMETASKSRPKTFQTSSKPGAAKAPPSLKLEKSAVADLRKASATGAYDDGSITNPGIGGTSTPKARLSTAEQSQIPIGHGNKDTSQSQNKRFSFPVPTQRDGEPQKKRYALNPPSKLHATQSVEASQFEIPLDEDDNTGKKTTGKTSKVTKTKMTAPALTGKPAKPTKAYTAVAIKKKSTPAALDESLVSHRSSQRAAAAKAKEKIGGIDKGSDSFDMDNDVELPSLHNARRVDGKIASSKTKPESKVESQHEVVKDERFESQYRAVGQDDKSKATNTKKPQIEVAWPVSESRMKVVETKNIAKKKALNKSYKLNDDAKDHMPTQIEDEEEVQRLQQEDAMKLGLIQPSSPSFKPEYFHANSTLEQLDKLPVKQELSKTITDQDKIDQDSSMNKSGHFAKKLGGMLSNVPDIADEVLLRRKRLQGLKLPSQVASPSRTSQGKYQSNRQDPIVISSPTSSETSSSTEFLGPNEESNNVASAPSTGGFVSPQTQGRSNQHMTASSAPKMDEPALMEANLLKHENETQHMASARRTEQQIAMKTPQVEASAQFSSSELLRSSQNDASSSFAELCDDSCMSRTEMVSDINVTKPTSTKVDIFKKPDLPAKNGSQLKVPKGPELHFAEPPTKMAAPAAPEAAEDVDVISSMNADNKIEEEERMDGARSKRKASTLENATSKKQRKENKSSAQVRLDVASKNIAQGRSSQNELELKPVPPSTATGSPDLPPHKHATAQTSSTAILAAPILEKDPSRRPHIIAFDRSGPLNQGQSSVAKPVKSMETRIIDREELLERKRKRNSEAVAGDPSPPKKRQNSSPVNKDDCDSEENAPMYNHSPVAALVGRHFSIRSRSTHSISYRQSSLSSRVDFNGSPVAAGQINHFGMLEERLSQAYNQHKTNDQQTDHAQPSTNTQDDSALFGPKILLGAKPKPRGSSPEEVASKYIAHERTGNGHYKVIGSKEVITPGNIVDPFVDRARKLGISSGFTDKLLKYSEAKDHHLDTAPQPSDEPRKFQNDKSQFKQMHHEIHKADHHAATINYRKSIRSQYAVEDPGKTLIASESRRPRHQSPESDESGSSKESVSSDDSKEDDPRVFKDVWNMAIRPHYSDAHRAIHAIADEVILRLSDEEERMHLIINQYDENSTKILDKLVAKREEGKRAILRKLDLKSKQMVTMYSDAKVHIEEKMDELKGNPTSGFQKEWHKKQEEIHKLISAGMAELK